MENENYSQELVDFKEKMLQFEIELEKVTSLLKRGTIKQNNLLNKN